MRWISAFIAFTVLCSVATADPQQERASAEATVILQILKECSSFLDLVVVNLSTDEVALIRRVMPKLEKSFSVSELLVSTAESKPPRLLPTATPSEISISVVDLTPSEAVILAGMGLRGPPFGTVRFVLRKKEGKWFIALRETNHEAGIPYETTLPYLTRRWR